MAPTRMTIATLGKELRELSELTAKNFAQVDARFAQVDARFEQLEQKFDSRFVEFAAEIKTAFKISLERMEAKLDAALDDTREQKRRLDVFDQTNAEEHRLMQTQIHELDAQLQSRRRPRGRS